jgi:hypothetical protein
VLWGVLFETSLEELTRAMRPRSPLRRGQQFPEKPGARPACPGSDSDERIAQKMERFDGIVIVAINLFAGLDAAALRRFAFKIEFRELDLTQRWKMFVAETDLADRLTAHRC